MLMYPVSELDVIDEIDVEGFKVDEELERLSEVKLELKLVVILDEEDDLDVEDEELFSRLLDDVVALNGGTSVPKALEGSGLGGLVVGALGELRDRVEVSVKVLVDICVCELADNSDGVTPVVERVLREGSELELREDCTSALVDVDKDTDGLDTVNDSET
jgi:hypothetical protein